MKYMILAAAVLASLAASAQRTIRMIVHEEPKDCRRMTEMTCLQVQIDGAKEWTLFYDKIKGFDYEPGYRYEIVVTETPRPEPVAQDLPRNNYKLEKIVSKTAITSGTADSPVWKVLSINGLQLNSDEFYFDFNEDSTMLAGKSGCNQFTVPVKFNSKRTKFTTGTATSTLMACADDAMKQETDFLSSLQNKKFKIRSSNEQVVYRKGWFRNVFVTEQFTPFAKNSMTMDSPWDKFDGKTMKLIQLNGKSVKGSEAQLVFDTANGRFTGNNGCNRISGNFTAEGTAIGFSGVVSTKMACVDENMQQTERQMMQILNSPGLSYDFAERVLNIYDGSGTLVMMLAQ
jgi:heat shock protein HslJ